MYTHNYFDSIVKRPEDSATIEQQDLLDSRKKLSEAEMKSKEKKSEVFNLDPQIEEVFQETL